MLPRTDFCAGEQVGWDSDQKWLSNLYQSLTVAFIENTFEVKWPEWSSLPLNSCVIFSKLLNLSGPLFPNSKTKMALLASFLKLSDYLLSSKIEFS